MKNVSAIVAVAQSVLTIFDVIWEREKGKGITEQFETVYKAWMELAAASTW
jgi:hypothetical protein